MATLHKFVKWCAWLSVLLAITASITLEARADDGGPQSPDAMVPRVRLPLILNPGSSSSSCQSVSQNYGRISPTNPAAGDVSKHPDVNLAVRGYASTTAYLGLVDYAGSVDPNAPQLYSLFSNNRTATFRSSFKVYRWDWTCNCRSGLIEKWPVTLSGLATTAGEVIRAPVAGYDIGGGYGAMVLYAAPTRLTLKYTREDDVIVGYTIHLENLCVDAKLLSLYNTLNSQGRNELPALYPGQALGRASGAEVRVAIRDGGSFLDPRSRKDWWQGR